MQKGGPMARNQGLSFIPRTKKRKWPVLLWLSLLVVFALLSMLVVNITLNKQLKVEEIKVPVLGLPKDLENFTLLHLSDLHGSFMGENHQNFLAAMEKKTFHGVCITGDMVHPKTHSATALFSLIDQIKVLNPQVPIYFIPGDEDPSPISSEGNAYSIYAPYLQELIARGVIFVDEPTQLEVKSTSLWFMPKNQYSSDPQRLYTSYQSQYSTSDSSSTNKGALEYYMDQNQRIITQREKIKPEDYQIVLSHYPLVQKELSTWLPLNENIPSPFNGIILSLSGHYNGGQWCLPFTSTPLFVPEKGFFPSKEGISGFHKVGSIPQYIHKGIGSSTFYPFPGRFFNAPTIALMSFTSRYTSSP